MSFSDDKMPTFRDIESLLEQKYISVERLEVDDPELVAIGIRLYSIQATRYFGFMLMLVPAEPTSQTVLNFSTYCGTDIKTTESEVEQLNHRLDLIQAVYDQNDGTLAFIASFNFKSGATIEVFKSFLDAWQQEIFYAIEIVAGDTYSEKGAPDAKVIAAFTSPAAKAVKKNNNLLLAAEEFKLSKQGLSDKKEKTKRGFFSF